MFLRESAGDSGAERVAGGTQSTDTVKLDQRGSEMMPDSGLVNHTPCWELE